MSWIFFIFLGLAFLILYFAYGYITYQAKANYFKALYEKSKKLLEQSKEQLNKEQENKASLKLQDEYKELQIKYETVLKEKIEKDKELEQLKAKLFESQEQLRVQIKESFASLANEILTQNKQEFENESKKSIQTLIKPLEGELKEFKEYLLKITKEEAKELSALQNELQHLKELNLVLSKKTEELNSALTGDNKAQGIWGEVVLERVLELSGLKKDREYKSEVVLKGSDGNIYRPDVVVFLPNNREVIIDAKTSLVAYKRYIQTKDPALKEGFLKAHIASIKRHIDKLSSKHYEKLEGINSLDFIFMFIPIEQALTLALEKDSLLFEYAFKRRVILVSPTTLLVALRAIESSWRYEYQAKAIQEVVKNAENLYDKVRGFVEDFQKVGNSLDAAQLSYENAFKKLSSGKGNILRQIEMLKEKANIKPKKELPRELIQD